MSAEFLGRRVVVMGLGRFGGGVGVTRWLAAQGARVLVTDQADAGSLAGSVAQLVGLNVSYRLGGHDEADLNGSDLLVVSPAVDKRKSSFVQAALRRGIPVSSEMNLFLERCPGRIVGVTGTVGKSTTAAMLYGVMSHAATLGELGPINVKLGGNIGQSLLGELEGMREKDLIVLELSSFQLEDARALCWSPPLAVLTNASPNHLDRHGTFDHYLECKLNICRYQKPGELIGLGACDARVTAQVREIADRTGARIFHAADRPPAALRVPGRHNELNAALAAAAAERLGASTASIRAGLEFFIGLPHRLQFVACIDGVRYYNDSKATTPGGVAVALESFDRPVILIAGGQEKPASWDAVVSLLTTRVKRSFCTGQNRQALARLLGGTEAATLEEAVTSARHHAEEGDVVLFSPGSPSYDGYPNYETRGEHFVRLIGALAQASSA